MSIKEQLLKENKSALREQLMQSSIETNNEETLDKYTTPGSHLDSKLATKLLPALDGLNPTEITMIGRALQSWMSGKYDYTRDPSAMGYNAHNSPLSSQLGYCISKEASKMSIEKLAKKRKLDKTAGR